MNYQCFYCINYIAIQCEHLNKLTFTLFHHFKTHFQCVHHQFNIKYKKITSDLFDGPSVGFARCRRGWWATSIQLFQIIQYQLRSLLWNVVDDQIAFVVFQNIFDFLHMRLIFAQCLQRFMGNQFRFLQKFLKLRFGHDQFIFEIIFELSLTLKQKEKSC